MREKEGRGWVERFPKCTSSFSTTSIIILLSLVLCMDLSVIFFIYKKYNPINWLYLFTENTVGILYRIFLETVGELINLFSWRRNFNLNHPWIRHPFKFALYGYAVSQDILGFFLKSTLLYLFILLRPP